MRWMIYVSIPVLLLAAAQPAANAEELRTAWTVELAAPLAGAPAAGPVSGGTGPDTLLLDVSGVLQCVDNTGKILWEMETELEGAACAPALFVDDRDALAAVAGSDAVLCVDARTGAERWREDLEGGGAARLVWADLDDDGAPELVADAPEALVVFDAEGMESWRFEGDGLDEAMRLAAPLAVCDVDGDHLPEIFAVSGAEAFSLAAEGVLRWNAAFDADFASGPVLADADDDGIFEIYAAAADGAVYALDADMGDELWRCADALQACETAGIGLGDINGDGRPEIAAVGGGACALLDADGTRLWQTELGRGRAARPVHRRRKRRRGARGPRRRRRRAR